ECRGLRDLARGNLRGVVESTRARARGILHGSMRIHEKPIVDDRKRSITKKILGCAILVGGLDMFDELRAVVEDTLESWRFTRREEARAGSRNGIRLALGRTRPDVVRERLLKIHRRLNGPDDPALRLRAR